MEALTKAANALTEAIKATTDAAKKVVPPPPDVSSITGAGWFTIFVLVVIANTLITIYFYPKMKPETLWIPGAWIWFKIRDYFWPVDPNANDPNKRKRFYSPPRIA